MRRKKVASQKLLNLPLFYNHFVFFKEKICFVLSLALLSEQKSNLNVENVDIIVMKTVNTFLTTDSASACYNILTLTRDF